MKKICVSLMLVGIVLFGGCDSRQAKIDNTIAIVRQIQNDPRYDSVLAELDKADPDSIQVPVIAFAAVCPAENFGTPCLAIVLSIICDDLKIDGIRLKFGEEKKHLPLTWTDMEWDKASVLYETMFKVDVPTDALFVDSCKFDSVQVTLMQGNAAVSRDYDLPATTRQLAQGSVPQYIYPPNAYPPTEK